MPYFTNGIQLKIHHFTKDSNMFFKVDFLVLSSVVLIQTTSFARRWINNNISRVHCLYKSSSSTLRRTFTRCMPAESLTRPLRRLRKQLLRWSYHTRQLLQHTCNLVVIVQLESDEKHQPSGGNYSQTHFLRDTQSLCSYNTSHRWSLIGQQQTPYSLQNPRGDFQQRRCKSFIDTFKSKEHKISLQ